MSENNKPHTPILDQLTEMNKAIEYAQMAYHDFLSNNVAAVLAELDRVHERPGYKRGNSALLTAIAKEAGLGQSSRHAMRFISPQKMRRTYHGKGKSRSVPPPGRRDLPGGSAVR